MIDLLVSCIADPGDGILVSRPHYNGEHQSLQKAVLPCLPSRAVLSGR